MLPQLFVNYKLKSVAALPWRSFMYKAFNTFIDDIFAFIITMPTAHRLACFRDDIVFVIYLVRATLTMTQWNSLHLLCWTERIFQNKFFFQTILVSTMAVSGWPDPFRRRNRSHCHNSWTEQRSTNNERNEKIEIKLHSYVEKFVERSHITHNKRRKKKKLYKMKTICFIE